MSKMELIALLKETLDSLDTIERHSFLDFIDTDIQFKDGQLHFAGAYIIYEGKEVLYIGSAGKGGHQLHYRMKDLFKSYDKGKKYYHTLTRKLMEGRFKSIEAVRRFYFQKCNLKIIQTDNIREARFLEYALICLMKTKYNNEWDNSS